MIDQDKMRALAAELRKYTGTGCVVDDANAAADAIDLLLAEVEAGKQQIDALLATVAECREKAFVEGYADSLLGAAVGSPDEVPAFVGQTVTELRAELEAAVADKRDGWRSMDDAPLDGTWVMLFARYPEATASTPTFGFHRKGKWWQSTRLGISELIPTYWMPRPAFPAALAQRQGEGS